MQSGTDYPAYIYRWRTNPKKGFTGTDQTRQMVCDEIKHQRNFTHEGAGFKACGFGTG